MKRRIALLLVLVLALSFVLASCGKCETHTDADIDEVCDVCGEAVPFTPTYLGFEGYYNTAYESDEKAALATVAKVDGLTGLSYSYSKSNGNLAVFEDTSAEAGEKKLAILNLDTGAVVYSLTQEKTEGEDAVKSEKTASVVSCGGNYFIRETYRSWNNPYYTKYEYTLYTALGVEIDSVVDSYNAPKDLKGDFMSFNGKIYLVEDDVATKKFDSDFIEIPDYDVKTDKFYYDVDGDTAYIFDQNFALVDVYETPYNADNSDVYVLADGNLFVQNRYILPEDAADFDYKVDAYNELGEAYTYKYNIETLIYNVETKATVEYNVNYVIGDGLINKLNEQFNEMFVADKLDNVAVIYEIVDGEIDYNEEKTVNIRTSDLKILGYLAQEIPEQSSIAMLFDDNRFIVRDKYGKSYLINEKAEVLGEVTDAYVAGDYANGYEVDAPESTFVTGKVVSDNYSSYFMPIKIYDSSLNLVYDEATMAKYDNYRGIVFTYMYQVKNAETDLYETKTEYYYMNASYKMTKLDITAAEASTIISGQNYFAYLDTVVENEGTENQKTVKSWVVCNNEGTEIYKLNIAATETGAVDAETGKVTTSSVVTGISSLDNGSIVINVTTTVKTEKTGADTKYEYVYDRYLAK